MVKIQFISPAKGYLTVKDDSVFPLNFAVGEVRDLSKRSGSFSKTITIDGTNNNNQLLNNYFDVNVVDGTFSVKKKQKCLVLEDQTVILDNCYLQLLNVNNDQGSITYEVSIKNNASDFFQIINQKELTDLDFSDFNHILNATNVTDTYPNTEGYKYVLPFFEGNDIKAVELLPCIFGKTYFDRIFQQAGYRYQWDSLANPDIRFDKLLIPYNGDGYVTDQLKTIVYDSALTVVDNDTMMLSELIDEDNRYNPGTGVYTCANTFTSGQPLKFITKARGRLRIANPEAFDIHIVNTFSGQWFNYGARVDVDCEPYVNTYRLPIAKFLGVSGGGANFADTITASSSIDLEFNTVFEQNIGQLNALDTFNFLAAIYEQKLNPADGWYNGAETVQVTVDLSVIFDSISIEVVPNTTTLLAGGLVEFNKYIPKKTKQSDFVKSIFQMYNIYAEPDRFDANLIILKTRDEYYDDGVVKDWTKLLSKNDEIVTQFLPEVSAKKYLLTYKQDEDEVNKTYFEATNEIYGQVEYTFESEFVRETQKNELIFSPTPFTTNVFGLSLSYIKGYTPKNNIRVLFDGGVRSCMEYRVNNDVFNDALTMTQYPLAIHLNDPATPSFDLNFGVCDFYFSVVNSLTNNNLWNYHWRRTLSQINNGKMLTAKFNLSALEIANVSLSDKIQIGNSFWNINRIIDYDANNNELTKVELITVDNDILLTPFMQRTPSNRSRGDFPLNFNTRNNINPNTSHIRGRENTVNSDAVIVGQKNVVSDDAVVVGNGNVVNGKSVVIGSNNTVEQNNVVVVGDNFTPAYDKSVYAEKLFGEVNPYFEYSVRTTNATVTDIITFTPEADGVYVIKSNVVGFQTTGSNATGIDIFAVFKVVSGVVTQVSTTDTVRKSNFPATVTATANTDGTQIRIRVTGQTGSTIDWKANLKKVS